MFAGFNQLPPSQGPLNAIEWDVSLSGSRTFAIQNQTTSPITVNLSGHVSVATDAGGGGFSYTTPVMLPGNPTQNVFVTEGIVGYSSSAQALGSPSLTSTYVGTDGVLTPAPTVSVTGMLDVPTTIATITPLTAFPTVDGTETIIYFAGSTFLVPAPPSVLIMGTGLMGVLALARRLLG
jgi:hypothetical protein